MTDENKHKSTSNHCEANPLHNSVRPQTLGEEDYQDHQESSNSSGGLCHLKWKTCFEALMDDRQGIMLFGRYLESEQKSDLLKFYLACNGFRSVYGIKDVDKLVKKFYKTFIKEGKIVLSKSTKNTVKDKLKRKSFDENMYDDAQNEVGEILKSQYPHFLQSDVYESYAKAELEYTRLGSSQAESPDRRKCGQSGTMPPDGSRSLKDDNDTTAATDVSYSFSTMSFLSTDDKNLSRAEPLGVKHERNQVLCKETKTRTEDRHQQQHQQQHDHDERTNNNNNRHHVSMVTASLIDSSSRSITSDPVNTDEFTSSSRDEREVVRSRVQWGQQGARGMMNYGNNEMNLKVQPRDVKRGPCNLAQDDPESFFRQVVTKLLEYLDQTEELNVREKERLPAPTTRHTNSNTNNNTNNNNTNTNNTNNNNINPSSRPHNRTLSHPSTNDNDHIRALDASMTWLDEGVARQRRDLNVTMPAHLSDFGSRSTRPPSHHPIGKFRHPAHAQWGDLYSYGPAPYQGMSNHQYDQYNQCPNRSLVQPNNQSLDASLHLNHSQNGRPYVTYADQYCPPHHHHHHQQHFQGGPVHPGMMMPYGQHANNSQNFSQQGLINEKIRSWMERCRKDSRESCGASENSLKRSTHTSNTEGTRKASGSQHSRVSESLQLLNQSVQQQKQQPQQQHDASRHPILNSTSTSNSTANTVVATDSMTTTTTMVNPPTVPPNHLSSFLPNHPSSFPPNHPSSFPPYQLFMAPPHQQAMAPPQTLAPPQNPSSPSFTIVHYCHVGDAIPYRIKIPARNVTFAEFKRCLKKKGKFRYCFKKLCPDFGHGAVYEEVVCDTEVLPLWDGMIDCKIDAMNSSDDEDAA